MTKDEVRAVWGEPDTIEDKGADKWGSRRELWVYEARLSGAVPVDVGYAAKTKHLEFDGENLVSFHE